MRFTAQVVLSWILSCSIPAIGFAQDPAVQTQTPGERALRVFLDCSYLCDFDYIRTEIPFVNYVRDRTDAQVHILVATQSTGGGGREYTLSFIGRAGFENATNVLRYVAAQTNTQDDTRVGLARTLKMGLMPYVAGSALAERIEISFADTPQKAAERDGTGRGDDDPWNQWVFEVGLNGFSHGESSYRSTYLSSDLSADRITAAWKIELGLSAGVQNDFFDTGDEEIESERSDYGISALVVRSLGGQWSSGLRFRARHSTYSNQDLSTRLGPAVEYNIYPYAESTHRQLRIQYSTGFNAIDYIEETVYFQTAERLVDHQLDISLGLRQPWGSANVTLSGSQYLQDLSKYQVGIGGSLNFRLVKGLSLRLSGDVSRIRNRIYVANQGATEEEILLRRRQLDTNYSYFTSFGIEYSFGSIYNNVVNPRFGG